MMENWGKNGTAFFPGKGYINRGIGGQTTAQMVVRFRQDVIELRPRRWSSWAGPMTWRGTRGR